MSCHNIAPEESRNVCILLTCRYTLPDEDNIGTYQEYVLHCEKMRPSQRTFLIPSGYRSFRTRVIKSLHGLIGRIKVFYQVAR